jgi:hypothetical protein
LLENIALKANQSELIKINQEGEWFNLKNIVYKSIKCKWYFSFIIKILNHAHSQQSNFRQTMIAFAPF